MIKKIGIACGCRKLNYGSILQSYALCSVIKNLGYDCNFVWVSGNIFKHYNIRPEKITGVIMNSLKHPSLVPKVYRSVRRVSGNKSHYSISPASRALFEKFVGEMDIRIYSRRALKKAEKEYYKFVCGSDQIWNSNDYYMDPMYFLRFTSMNKRIAYAPSFGTSNISYYNRNTIRKYLSEFESISVREKSGRNICRKLIGKDVPVVLDPTMLMTQNQWESNLSLSGSDEGYCFAYFLNQPSASAVQALMRIREKMPVICLPVKYDCFNEEELAEAGPKEFLECLNNAQYVMTDSFHGTIFSINFNKQFLTFDRQYLTNTTQSTRIKGILKELGLGSRFVKNDENVTYEMITSVIPYDTVNHKLQIMRDKSRQYLENALK